MYCTIRGRVNSGNYTIKRREDSWKAKIKVSITFKSAISISMEAGRPQQAYGSHEQDYKPLSENGDSEVNGSHEKDYKPLPEAADSEESLKPGCEVVALYEYEPTSQNDIPFKKGDKLRILDSSHSDWRRAINLRTQMEGFIPSKYAAVVDSVASEEWFHREILEKEAESLLLNSGRGTGTFLIYKRIKEGYALSLLYWDATAKKCLVVHYAIGVNSKKYVLDSKSNYQFNSLQELVNVYSADSHELETRLLTPCPKTRPNLWDLSSKTKDKWEVDRKNFQLGELLGEGNYGQVFLGYYQGVLEDKVAIKTLKPGMMSPEAFMAEATIMKSLRHKNLVSLYAVCSKEEPIWIITEYVPKGSLLTHLQSAEGRELPFNTLLYMAAQVAFGMAYLESRQLIHRDLAARNILVGNNDLVKIADFGLARVIKKDGIYVYTSKIGIPIKWTAPEVLLDHECSVKSDVWSFGILLMEIVTHGAEPYSDLSNKQVLSLVPNGYRMDRPTNCHCPEDLYEVMKQCWDNDPKQRPNFENLFAFLNDYTVSKEKEESNQDSCILI